MTAKKTTEQFIKEAKEKRTDVDFDYSKVVYINYQTKVTIIDPEFGEFEIAPAHFLRGTNHPSRSGTKKPTTIEFVIKGKEARTDIDFDYSKVNYVNNHTKVTIIDPEFGEFEIRPNNFLLGEGHPARGIKTSIYKRTKTTEQFIKEGKEVRTDVDFDYSKVVYNQRNSKVTIIDPEFGEFEIRPSDFLRGVGHPARSGNKKPSTIEFIANAKEQRTNIDFDYSKVNYVNSYTKVTIIDPEFGEFKITPARFLRGEGHPLRAGKGHNALYFIIVRDEVGQFVKFKFGLATNHTLSGRINAYCRAVMRYNKKYGTNFSTHVACTIEFDDTKSARDIESNIHNALRKEFLCGFTQSSNKFTGTNTETYGSEAFTLFERLIVGELNNVASNYTTHHSTDVVDALLYGVI